MAKVSNLFPSPMLENAHLDLPEQSLHSEVELNDNETLS
jgi:hypothetical protein